jgi:glycosyltransferase involved in cell wall biosynthesis
LQVRNRPRLQTAHVCLFTDSLEPSGVGEHMLTLAGELRATYRISFVCPPTPQGQALLQRAERMGCKTLALEARYNTPQLAELYDWVCDQDIDIFHCHAGITWEGFGGTQVARQAHVPVALRTEHLPYLLTHPVQRVDHRRAVEQVDRIICVSQASYATYIEAGVPAHKLAVVRNGIRPRPARTDRATALAAVGLDPASEVIINVARLAPQKGHHLLADAIPAVLRARPNARFLLIGEGPLHDELAARLRDEGLDSRAQLLGKRPDVPDLLAAADLFVLPSHFEGLPISALEAMAAGLPVVATRVSGTSEAVVDGVTGRLVEPNDAPALAAAMIAALSDRALARRWGAAGRKRVADEFSAGMMARAVDKIYVNLLQGARRLDGATALHLAPPGKAKVAL